VCRLSAAQVLQVEVIRKVKVTGSSEDTSVLRGQGNFLFKLVNISIFKYYTIMLIYEKRSRLYSFES
jgi:hypothetical protein